MYLRDSNKIEPRSRSTVLRALGQIEGFTKCTRLEGWDENPSKKQCLYFVVFVVKGVFVGGSKSVTEFLQRPLDRRSGTASEEGEHRVRSVAEEAVRA